MNINRNNHQYFFGLAMPGGESTVYSTTSTPCAVSLADGVSVSTSSSLARPRSCRYSSSRRTCLSERPIFTSWSTRQRMLSLTPTGRPASRTRRIRQRASSRSFCSSSAPLDIFFHLIFFHLIFGLLKPHSHSLPCPSLPSLE